MRADRQANSLIASISIVATLIVLCVPLAHAADQTGTIEGVVLDDQNQPYAGATIALSGENLQGQRAAITEADGTFVFRGLAPGVYELVATSPERAPVKVSLIRVNIGRTAHVEVPMRQATETEEITVRGAAAQIDRTATQTQDNYTSEYLSRVQTGQAGRDYLAVINNSAGVVGTGNVAVRGATLGENVYLIDGVDSTDPVTSTFGTNFIFDAVQEVQLQTGGFQAEFGRATGGVVNVVTKSGGNQFSGTLDYRFRNNNFAEKGDFFDPDESDAESQVAELTFGGPIVKDKLWFFVAGSLLDNSVAPSGSPTARKFDGTYYLGKLTWQVNPNHKLTLQTTGDPATIDNDDAGLLVDPEATTQQEQGSRFTTLQYQWIAGPQFLIDAQVADYRAYLDTEPQSGDFDTIGWIDFFTGEQSRNAIDTQHTDRFRQQASAAVTYSPVRNHTFKGGVDFQRVKFKFDQSTPGGEYWQVVPDALGNPTPLIITTTESVGQLENEGNINGYFVQDEWRLGRFTLNPGLRYDTFSYDDNVGHEVFSAGMLQPRFGVSWDVGGNGKNVVKASAGRFAHPSLLGLPSLVNTRANVSDVFLNENVLGYLVTGNPEPFDLDGDGTISERVLFDTLGGPGGVRFSRNGDLDPTYVTEYQAGYERLLGPQTTIGLTLVHRDTKDIIEDFFDEARGVYFIDNIPGLKRTYRGAELRFRTRIARVFLDTSYTYSKAKGNVEYTQSAGVDYDFPVLSTNRFGFLSTDQRHAVKINGYADLPWQMQLGFSAFFRTGRPYQKERSANPYGEEFLEPRGSRRLSSVHQVDGELRKYFRFNKFNMALIGTVENLLDTERVLLVNSLETDFGTALVYQQPRRYEVGVRFEY
ncbi:MAG: TonB-dependent receptor [Acidobacteria bacterium]|nr:TonB-dependent receptor [Acidobacteriota bacterium]